ncbi:MAG: FAD-binding oxidoreductase [Deltaproteobacteria bacterium]|mgnify:CR=1 FL=1|nr:MAG: FAD-binding oxidoreductase [Deltaproteobacteria bacterium]
MKDIALLLAEIVGERYVSDRPEEIYFYARDPGLMPPHKPNYVVIPKTTQQIQKIVRLANQQRIPVVPMGAGMSLTGLVIPLKGGIVIDMKRMNKIIEVNEKARYVIVEGGTSQGALKAYLEKNYPRLRHSIPDAPAAATIAANIMIHGQGRLTQQYGFNSDMVAGLEVVLPSGQICKIGSCSLVPGWFSKGAPLPDLSGLFLGWFGATGIITKVALKLYPKKKMRDVEIFITDREDLVPDIVYELTHTEMAEDINIFAQPLPMIFKDNHHITIFITGDTDDELEFKRKMIWGALDGFIKSKDGGFMSIPPALKSTLLEMPQRSVSRFADVKKGGGFEYSGPILLVERYPDCSRKLVELASKYDLAYSAMARIIGRGHCMMFGFSFTFNRADPDMMARVREALQEVSEYVLEIGGVFWKPTIDEQRLAIERMDPTTLNLMKMIKRNLDPNGIMNPGNWEVT